MRKEKGFRVPGGIRVPGRGKLEYLGEGIRMPERGGWSIWKRG